MATPHKIGTVTHLQHRITGIEIRGFMRILAVALAVDPSSGLVLIGGENAQGKSSVLCAIEAALTALPNSVKVPIHAGEEQATIRITIPPYEVRRAYMQDGRPYLAVVRTDDGSKIDNPSQFLKELLGAMIDPVDFMNAQPIEQRRRLQSIVGLDTTEIDAQITRRPKSESGLRKRRSGSKGKPSSCLGMKTPRRRSFRSRNSAPRSRRRFARTRPSSKSASTQSASAMKP